MNQTDRSNYRHLQKMAESLSTSYVVLDHIPTDNMTEDQLLELDVIKRKYMTLMERVQTFQEKIAGRHIQPVALDEDQI